MFIVLVLYFDLQPCEVPHLLTCGVTVTHVVCSRVHSAVLVHVVLCSSMN